MPSRTPELLNAIAWRILPHQLRSQWVRRVYSRVNRTRLRRFQAGNQAGLGAQPRSNQNGMAIVMPCYNTLIGWKDLLLCGFM